MVHDLRQGNLSVSCTALISKNKGKVMIRCLENGKCITGIASVSRIGNVHGFLQETKMNRAVVWKLL